MKPNDMLLAAGQEVAPYALGADQVVYGEELCWEWFW